MQQQQQKKIYYLWKKGKNRKFKNVHKECNETLKGCTVNNIGQGGLNQMESCTDYMQENQYNTTLNKQQIYFLKYGSGKCLKKRFDIFGQKTDYESTVYKQGNSLCHQDNLQRCMKKQDGQLIVKEIDANKKGEAQKNKAHYTDLKIINNYHKCQEYDRNFDCVTSGNGGCKNRPSICSGYVGEENFCSIKDQGCIWINQYGQLNNAIILHHNMHILIVNYQGILWGNQKVAVLPYSKNVGCDQNLQRKECFCLNNKFILLIWRQENALNLDNFQNNQIKLPNCSISQACQISLNCIINIYQFGCVDYFCDKIS
ncbi:unnamed protein product [Paramecium sonneborni]|uniref:Uncharacterized protein n=1 Tax=Paramecium sonneborni TaxID=65129 RepID=A0A8S1NLS1_9CILI|nr:unnamed protein product [Paramecium sonneborni]